jgi:hypothetical protein
VQIKVVKICVTTVEGFKKKEKKILSPLKASFSGINKRKEILLNLNMKC